MKPGAVVEVVDVDVVVLDVVVLSGRRVVDVVDVVDEVEDVVDSDVEVVPPDPSSGGACSLNGTGALAPPIT